MSLIGEDTLPSQVAQGYHLRGSLWHSPWLWMTSLQRNGERLTKYAQILNSHRIKKGQIWEKTRACSVAMNQTQKVRHVTM